MSSARLIDLLWALGFVLAGAATIGLTVKSGPGGQGPFGLPPSTLRYAGSIASGFLLIGLGLLAALSVTLGWTN